MLGLVRDLCGNAHIEILLPHSSAAGKLQSAGLIQYGRGRITVTDRPGLEARACECYQVVNTEFDRLLPHTIGS